MRGRTALAATVEAKAPYNRAAMPDNLRHYSLGQKLGSGRLGDVFSAQDTRVGRTVAIRIVKPAISREPHARDRLLEDARRAAALSHANVACLVEWGEEDDQVFLAFEFVHGERLGAEIAGRPLNVRRAIDIGVQIADALAEGHGLGLVHGDLRPDQIVITPKGRPKILDFGFLSWTNGGHVRQAVADLASVDRSHVVSIVAYMSPEQALGEAIDHRTDIFSLGVLLYEMVTGRSPFLAETPSATLVRILQTQPPAPSSFNPLVPPILDRIIQRALAKSLAVRYDNAALLATELRQAGLELDVRSESAVREETAIPLPVKRHGRRAVRLASAFVLVALAGVLAFLLGPRVRKFYEQRSRPARPAVVASLPFDAAAGTRQGEYFSTGFGEDLLARLAQVDGLRVVGRRSMRAYRGLAPGVVGEETGARFVLAGEVGLEAQQVQAVVRLFDPDTGGELWNGRFSRDAEQIFALQAEIAEEVARQMRLTLTPSPARDRTALRVTKPAAYDLYLQGRNAAANYDYARAIPLLEQAVAVDGALAEAQAALAIALAAARDLSGEWTASVAERITAAAGAAMAADPDLPAAHIAMAAAEAGQAGALEYLRRAIELDPDQSTAYNHFADEVAAIEPSLACAFYGRALELDPRFDETYRDRAEAHILLGEFDEAMKDVVSGRALSPARWWWQALAARIEFERGRLEEGLAAAAQADLVGRSAPILVAYASALQTGGRSSEAIEAVSKSRVMSPGSCLPSALMAGLEFDAGRRREGLERAREIMEMAQAPGASDSLHPCAAMAAASIGDAQSAAEWLRRIAASDTASRRWFREGHGGCHFLALERGAYPWNKVSEHPLVLSAQAEIDKARLRLRAEVVRVAEGFLDRDRERAAVQPGDGEVPPGQP